MTGLDHEQWSIYSSYLVLLWHRVVVQERSKQHTRCLGLIKTRPEASALDGDEGEVPQLPDEPADLVLSAVAPVDPPLSPYLLDGHAEFVFETLHPLLGANDGHGRVYVP